MSNPAAPRHAPLLISAARPIWLVSAAVTTAAAVATELYGLAARAIGVPMTAGDPGGTVATPITIGMFAMAVLISLFWGTILAIALARYARHPARTYLRATLALTGLSLAGPLAAGDTAIATKLMLGGAHLLAAAIVIPVLTRRLALAPGRQPPPSAANAAAQTQSQPKRP